MNPKYVLPLAFSTLLAPLLHAVDSTAATPKPETPLEYEARIHWLREARFGMFIHWGVYAATSGEWKGKYYTSGGEWIERIANIPIAEYKALGKDFTAAKYDPKAWADLARDAGMKYVVITAKHHDGFALYDSQVSDWNAVRASAAHRDLLAPLAAAVRADGLKFCLYYSQSQDWTHPGGGNFGNAPKWDPAQDGDYDVYLQKTALPQVREILSRFHPAVLWWDTPVNMTPERAKPFADLLREVAPGIISNGRLGGGFGGDTINAEQSVPSRPSPAVGKLLEVCMTINGTWGYKQKDQAWKSTHQLLHVLTDTASKGGNLLLNVGPTADGEFPPETVDRLQAMGRWMKLNGEAIYATDAGPFPRPLPWGRTTQKHAVQRRDDPLSPRLELARRTANSCSRRSMTNRSPAACSRPARPSRRRTHADGLVVTLPGRAPDADVSVCRVGVRRSADRHAAKFRCPRPRWPDQHRRARQLPGRRTDGSHHAGATRSTRRILTAWTDPGWYVEYHVKTPAAGRWTVSAEFAADAPAKLTLTAKDVKVPFEVSPTGGKLAWKTRRDRRAGPACR